MKYRALLGAAAIISTSLSPILTTAAWADDGDDIPDITLYPVNLNNPDGPPATPQEVCDEALRPAAASGFVTEPLSTTDSGWVNDGPPYFDPNPSTGPAGDPSGYGTPTASNVILSHSYFRNGGSPNVWALAQATLTYPQTQQLWNLLVDQTDTETVACHVYKWVGQNSPNGPHLVEPPGLQTTGNIATGHQTVAAGTAIKITDDDFVITGDTVVALICISPGTKGGKWTGKNGFPASQCAAASTAAGGTIPSGNIPQI